MSRSDYSKTAKLNVYYGHAISFFNQLIFSLGLWYVFGESFRGWNPLQIFILFGVGWELSFFFEIPTGILADKFGRLKVFRFGGLMQAIAYLTLGLSTNLYLLAIAMIINAVGAAAFSGTIDPIIGLSLSRANSKNNIQNYQGNDLAISRISRLIAISLAPLLYKVWPPLIFIGYSVSCLFAVFSSYGIRDYDIYEKPEESTILKHFKQALLLIRDNKNLQIVMFISVAFINSELIWSLTQPIGESIDLGVDKISFLFAVSVLISAVSALFLKKYYKGIYSIKALIIIRVTVVSLSLLVLLKMKAFLVLVVINIIVSVSVGATRPYALTYFQHHVDRKYISTVISIFSAAYSIALIVMNIASGYLLKNYSIDAAIILGLVFSALSLISVGILIRRADHEKP